MSRARANSSSVAPLASSSSAGTRDNAPSGRSRIGGDGGGVQGDEVVVVFHAGSSNAKTRGDGGARRGVEGESGRLGELGEVFAQGLSLHLRGRGEEKKVETGVGEETRAEHGADGGGLVSFRHRATGDPRGGVAHGGRLGGGPRDARHGLVAAHAVRGGEMVGDGEEAHHEVVARGVDGDHRYLGGLDE